MRRETPAYGKMSSSGRRRSSKWDLKEESHIPFENIHDKPWPGKAGLSFHDKEKCESLSPEAAGGNHSKWSVPEPLPGRRGSRRNDSIDAVRNRNLKAMTTWDGKESYGTRMSPGLDEWRQQNHHNSPKNEWKGSKSRSRSQSRSRSRSPIHGFGREPGLYDRCRSRSGASAQLCKDYVSGRCRRGNHCQFLHAQTYEDEWERHRKTMASKYSMPCDSEEYPSGSGRSTDCCNEFLEGNCRRGSSCRFAHHGASHVTGKVSSNDAIRDRNNDRRQRDASLERYSNREPRRTVDIPCKFFSAGNCRNGKYCRFSHQSRGNPSPDRSGDDRISLDHDSVHVDKLWNKWSTTTSDAGKLSEDKDQIIGATDQRGTAWSVDNRWGYCLEEDKKLSDTPIDHTMVEIEKKEALLWKTENAGDSIRASEQRIGENWLGDTDMSPEWNYKIRPSKNVDKEGHGSLTNCDPSTTQQASVQMHDSTVVMPSEINESFAKPLDFNLPYVGVSALPHDNKSMAEKIASSQGSILSNMISVHSINQNGLNSNALPLTCLNSGGNENPQIQTLVQGEKTINNPDIVEPTASQVKSGVAITENNVSSEQLTTISVSLAQLFAKGQQLPQFYFAHSSHAHNIPEMSSVANSEGPIKTDSAVNMQSNECIEIEAEKNEVNNNPPGFFPACIRQTNNTNGKPDMTSKNKLPSSVGVASKSGDNDKFCSLEEANDKKCQLNQLEPGANSIVTNKNNGVLNEENRKFEEDKPAQENGPLEYIDGDDKMDEGKKGKDVKGIRAFKFALVEFVKELLKPTWKEGQMSKDAYKNIVKKVVDKVMGTMQGANIPQTQEKVQQYLSLSKPKLTKLVQAYVEKFQKDK